MDQKRKLQFKIIEEAKEKTLLYSRTKKFELDNKELRKVCKTQR